MTVPGCAAPASVEIRRAVESDVAAVCAFGAVVLPAHYTPLIGADAAQELVADWWSAPATLRAVDAQALWVALDADGEIVGVGELGHIGDDPVIYKLYIGAHRRGEGIGALLIDRMIATLAPRTPRVLIEHVAANDRAAAFYERQGFVVDHVDVIDPHAPERDVVWRARELAA